MRIIVGISGATGVVYGVRLLERLRQAGAETHLVISRWGVRTLLHETTWTKDAAESLAHATYAPGDMGGGDCQRIVQDRRHGHRSLQRQDPGRDRQRHR